MKIVTKKFKVYTYDELTVEVKHKVVYAFVDWVIEYVPYDHLSDDMKRAVDKSESMQTPWFVGSYIVEYAMDEIIEDVKTQNYLRHGEIFNE